MTTSYLLDDSSILAIWLDICGMELGLSKPDFVSGNSTLTRAVCIIWYLAQLRIM